APALVRHGAPRAGQHTTEVLDPPGGPTTESTTTPSRPPDTRPLLDGVHILDFGHYYAGPYSSRLLADLGADVIKLEPLAGDQLRGLSRPFRSAQAGKRSIALDLKDADLGDARVAL